MGAAVGSLTKPFLSTFDSFCSIHTPRALLFSTRLPTYQPIETANSAAASSPRPPLRRLTSPNPAQSLPACLRRASILVRCCVPLRHSSPLRSPSRSNRLQDARCRVLCIQQHPLSGHGGDGAFPGTPPPSRLHRPPASGRAVAEAALPARGRCAGVWSLPPAPASTVTWPAGLQRHACRHSITWFRCTAGSSRQRGRRSR